MGIWIRSQDKEILMNLEYFEIQEPNYEEVKAVISCRCNFVYQMPQDDEVLCDE